MWTCTSLYRIYDRKLNLDNDRLDIILLNEYVVNIYEMKINIDDINTSVYDILNKSNAELSDFLK